MGELPTLVIYHRKMAQEGYPVLAGRLQPAFDYLQETGTLQSPKVRLEEAQPVDEKLLRQVHSDSHIRRVQRSGYDEAARLSAGAAVRAGEAVWLGEAANAFVFTGCAGHHASRDSCWGFCYYNNTALLVRRLQQAHGVKSFLIVDTDPHFGDGTRDILGEDSTVYHLNFYASFSLRELPETPHRVDVPLPGDCSDTAFLEALSRLAPPLAKTAKPQIILWNMGHDAHWDDYGGFQLSLAAFPKATDILLSLAQELCAGKLVVLLSGGSEVHVARHAISSIIRRLASLSPLDQDTRDVRPPEREETLKEARTITDRIMDALHLNEL